MVPNSPRLHPNTTRTTRKQDMVEDNQKGMVEAKVCVYVCVCVCVRVCVCSCSVSTHSLVQAHLHLRLQRLRKVLDGKVAHEGQKRRGARPHHAIFEAVNAKAQPLDAPQRTENGPRVVAVPGSRQQRV